MTRAEIDAREELGIAPESKDVFGKRARAFDALVGEIASAQEQKRQAEAEIKRIQKLLEDYFVDSDSKTVLSGGNRVTLVLSSSSHLDKKALIEAGVAAQTIVACTKTTQYSFVKITPPKEPVSR